MAGMIRLVDAAQSQQPIFAYTVLHGVLQLLFTPTAAILHSTGFATIEAFLCKSLSQLDGHPPSRDIVPHNLVGAPPVALHQSLAQLLPLQIKTPLATLPRQSPRPSSRRIRFC